MVQTRAISRNLLSDANTDEAGHCRKGCKCPTGHGNRPRGGQVYLHPDAQASGTGRPFNGAIKRGAQTIIIAEQYLSQSCAVMARLVLAYGRCPIIERDFSPFQTLAGSIVAAAFLQSGCYDQAPRAGGRAELHSRGMSKRVVRCLARCRAFDPKDPLNR
jgi:hypothetical protein